MGTAGPDQGLRVDLVRRAASLTATVNQFALDHLEGRPTAGFDLVGAGTEAIDAGFARLEPLSKTVMCSVIPVLTFNPWDPAEELNQRSIDRGVELRTIVSERSLAANPLLSSLDQAVRIGHAVTTLYLVDRVRAVLPGPLDHDGFATAWTATNPEVLVPTLELWDLIWESSRPIVPDGEAAPFTQRQVRTAVLLARGAKDTSIARELGVSVRTVVSEVATIAARLGATSRLDAVFILRNGRGRP